MARIEVPVQLRWSDMDAYAHVNNVEMLRLLEEARVALSPGSAFGPSGEGYVRIAYPSDEAILREGLRRIAAFMEKLRGEGRL